MQTSAFGKSKGLWKTLSEGTWGEAFDGLGISLLLTTNPSIQVVDRAFLFESSILIFLFVKISLAMLCLFNYALNI